MSTSTPKIEILVDSISKILTVISFVFQFLPSIPLLWKILMIILVLALYIVIFISNYINRTVINRKSMIKRGKNIINNTMGKVALFGGDITWAEDYYEEIVKVVADGKTVEVFYPLEKEASLSKDAQVAFFARLERLKERGVNIYNFGGFGSLCG